MNISHKVDLLMNVVYIRCKFQSSSKLYTYKTTLSVSSGDFGLVSSPAGFSVVEIVEVFHPTEATTDRIQDLNYSSIAWMFQLIDKTKYEDLGVLENEILTDVQASIEETAKKIETEELKSLLGDTLVTKIKDKVKRF